MYIVSKVSISKILSNKMLVTKGLQHEYTVSIILFKIYLQHGNKSENGIQMDGYIVLFVDGCKNMMMRKICFITERGMSEPRLKK